jgi:hypothetical protein
MEQQINKIYKQLLDAQKSFKSAVKDATNPHFGKKYADLTSVWDACRDALHEVGLFVSQQTEIKEDGKIILHTKVINEHGESISSPIPVICANMSDPQKFGSALTYARRYGLSSLLGIVTDDDDDGNSAAGVSEQKKAQQQSKPANKNADMQRFEAEAKKPELASDSQKAILTNLINTSALSEEDKKKSLDWLKTDKATKDKVGEKIAKLSERINAAKTTSDLPV